MKEPVKKRLGIMTFHRAINYGAVLQCFALKSVCEDLGFSVNTIDYNPFGHYTYRGLMKHRPGKTISNVLTFRSMNRFVDRFLSPTAHTETVPPDCSCYDAVVVGSDTVWHEPVVGRLINSYLLEFIPDGDDVRKIAYAASIGGETEISKEYRNLFIKELPKFHAISVREQQSAPVIQSVSNMAVADVCDPSLLLGQADYEKIEHEIRTPKHYIAVFDLAGDPEIKKVALELKEKTGYECVNISFSPLKWVDKNYYGVSPNEWLSLIHKADFICTNSFHGTCFSLIYEKPFIFVPVRKGVRSAVNGRIENLLANTGLCGRIYDGKDIPDSFLQLEYAPVRRNILEYISRSKAWLKSALS